MRRARRPQPRVVAALCAAFALGAWAPVGLGAAETATPTVVRNALAQTSAVQGAPGRTMVLSRVTVDPGAELALHHHLGTQIARVTAGTLTYTVREGSVAVRRGESDQDPQVVRTIKAGQTGRIQAGEWIVEQPSAIHQAANRGTQRVVIYIATLLKDGAPPATPVSPPPTR